MSAKPLSTLARGWLPLALCLCLAAGVLLPWQLGSVNLYAAQRGFQLLSIGLAVGLSGLQYRHTLTALLVVRPGPRAGLVLLGVGLLVALSLWQAPFLGVALLELVYLLVLGVTAGLVAISVRQWPRLGWAPLVWRVLGGLLALLMLIHAFLAIDHISLVWSFAIWHDFGPGFAHVRFFADVAVGVMPLAMLYALARPTPSRMAAALCVVPLTGWWWLLWVSESRAALLGLIVGALVALWLFGRAARWPVVILALSGALGLAGWWFLNPLGGGATGEVFWRDITSSSGRLVLWGDALRYAVEHFPLGIGPMGYAGDGQLRGAHAHNLFLNTAAEWGLPLALLLLALLLYGCWVIVRRARAMPQADKPLYACLVMAFVGVMVNAQFAGAHIIPLSALVMVLAVGLVFGYRPAGEPLPPEPSGPAPLRVTLLWAALMLMLAYLLYAGLELYWISEDSAVTCFQELGRAHYYPRFWAQGRLECMQMVAPDHWLFGS